MFSLTRVKACLFLPTDGCSSVGGGHHTNPNFVPRKTVSSPAALGSTSGSSAAVLCARPVDGQLDPKMPDFILIFSFLLSAITLLSQGVQLVADFGRREDG